MFRARIQLTWLCLDVALKWTREEEREQVALVFKILSDSPQNWEISGAVIDVCCGERPPKEENEKLWKKSYFSSITMRRQYYTDFCELSMVMYFDYIHFSLSSIISECYNRLPQP